MEKKHRKSDDRLKGYVTVEGKKYWVQGYSQEELQEKKEAKIRAVKAELALQQNSKGGNKTVEKWAEEWLALYKEKYVNSRHLSDIEGRLKNWVFPVIGKERLKDVEQTEIQFIMNSLEGKSRSLIEKVYNDVNGLFKQAVFNRYIIYNPVMGVKKPEGAPVKERRSITDAERAVLLKTVETFNGGIFYLIMLYAGLRPGEVAALRLKHIDFKEKVIHVKDALKSDGSLAQATDSYNGKTVNATRDVFLSKELEKAIKKVKKDEKLKPNDFIAHKRRGKEHHTKDSMRDMWDAFRLAMHIQMGGKTAREELGYTHVERDEEGNVISTKDIKYTVEVPVKDRVAKDLVAYDLRHTFCTDLRERGVPIEEAKDLMGHADIALTAKIYSHATKRSVENARKLYDREV